LSEINTRRRPYAMLRSSEGDVMQKRYLAVLGLTLLCSAAAAQPLAMDERNGVRWVCAGVGQGEREALARMEAGTNLKLVFAAGKEGAYLANVEVVLTDREGKRPALKFFAAAPICLVQAPAGRYHVEAVFRDVKRALDTQVPQGGKQPGMLVFRFPSQ
jgi:hypothetical protein